MSYRIPAAHCLFLCPVPHNGKDTEWLTGKSAIDSVKKQLLGQLLKTDETVHVTTSNEECSNSFTVAGIWSTAVIGEGRITRSTQVFILLTPTDVWPLRVGIPFKRGVDGLINVYQDGIGEELLQSVDESISLALCGVFGSFFRGGAQHAGRGSSFDGDVAGAASSCLLLPVPAVSSSQWQLLIEPVSCLCV